MNRVIRKAVSISRVIHVFCSMLAAGALVFFAVTGFMLNNYTMFYAEGPEDTTAELALPAEMVSAADQDAVVAHLRNECGVTGLLDEFLVDGDMMELTFRRPGGRTDVTINRPDGQTEILTERGTLTDVLLDMHKGSSTGRSWGILIDVAAVCLVIACITGIVLWLATPKRRMLGLIALLAGLAAWCGAYFFCVPK